MNYEWYNSPPENLGKETIGKTVKHFIVLDTLDDVYFRIVFTDGSAISFKDPDSVDYNEADKPSDVAKGQHD